MQGPPTVLLWKDTTHAAVGVSQAKVIRWKGSEAGSLGAQFKLFHHGVDG